MYTKRSIVFQLCLISVALSFGESVWGQSAVQNTLVNEPCVVPRDEVEVFSAYLRHFHERAVVVTRTEVHNLDLDTLNLGLAAQGHGIPPGIREDFKRKNHSSCFIMPFAGVPRLRFVSSTEEKWIFRKGVSGWIVFHKRYGKDTSIEQFSRVAFNSNKTLALLHVSGGIASMGAGGDLCMFERKGGRWVLKWHRETWAA